jgi:CelD/BcsL family acetyltransferase involved in cellulose biosynthesis
MRTEILKTNEEFARMRGEWNRLLSQSAADTIFLTWEWLWSWWESYAQPADGLHIIVIRDVDGQAAGIVPLFIRKEGWPSIYRRKTLRFIGDGSWDSDYLDMIVRTADEEQILNSIWEYLRSNKRLWDMMELPAVPETSPTLKWLSKLRSAREVMLRPTQVSFAMTPFPALWDEYLMTLSPRFRTKIRSTLRNLEEMHDFRFYSIESETDLAAGLDTLFDLHARRWKEKGQQGVFANQAKRHFYYSFASQFLRQRWLAFDFLKVDGNTVACQLSFRYKGTQFLLQEGFDPDFGAESVGIALRAMVFRKAIHEGISNYDFLAGIGRHKTQWGAQLKECQKVSVARPTFQNAIYIKTPVVVAAMKERVKAILPDKVLELRRRLLTS